MTSSARTALGVLPVSQSIIHSTAPVNGIGRRPVRPRITAGAMASTLMNALSATTARMSESRRRGAQRDDRAERVAEHRHAAAVDFGASREKASAAVTSSVSRCPRVE